MTLVEDVAGRVDRHPWEVLDFLGVPGKRETYSGNIFRAVPMVKAEKPITTDTFKSKHLKGRLAPPVSDVTFFGPKEVSWSPTVSDVTFFGPKEVSWSPLSVT